MNKHEGHELRYENGGLWSFPVKEIVPSGDVWVDWEDLRIEDVHDTCLVCETCGRVVTGEEVGAGPDYDVRP